MRRKFFIIDTSVLLYDKNSIKSFPNNDVILPITVLDELDRNKSREGIVGENARFVNRYLDSLRSYGRLDKGVRIKDTGQTVRILSSRVNPASSESVDLDKSSGDNRIILAALYLRSQFKKKPVIVVTKDINLRVKCDALGIAAEDYYKDYINLINGGTSHFFISTIVLSEHNVNELYTNGHIDYHSSSKQKLNENEYIVGKSDSKKSILCRYNNKRLHKIRNTDLSHIGQISPKNKEQSFALDALLSSDISLVCLTGIAGSGKTFLTLMCALEGFYAKKYDRIVITRSIQPVGKDLGFLPGDVKEKMSPWMAPLVDNFRHAFKNLSYFEMMMSKGQIEISPLSYIRGRTFSNAFIIVDEAQNATIHELKTIITRVGEGSKIALMGDTDQVDTPYIDRRSNGLSIVINKMKESSMVAHVHLPKGERSKLATLASKTL